MITAAPAFPGSNRAFVRSLLLALLTAAGIGDELVVEVPVLVAIPEMMMRVDDLERRLQNLLFPHLKDAGAAPAFFGVLGALDRFLNRGQSLRDLVGPA